MLYYETPPDEIFEEVKEKAKLVWMSIFEEGSNEDYRNEKLSRINITNIRDNMMYIVALFDINNQRKLSMLLSDEAKKAISDRIISGGGEENNIFRLNC
jgi:hypothetical protein